MMASETPCYVQSGDIEQADKPQGREVLFVGTAEAEHVEMYLKAIWHTRETGTPVKISTIARMLNVKQPSVVQMLKKLNDKKLVKYNKAGVKLTEEGEAIGSSMMRNSRLLEVLMDSALKIAIDEEMVCGIEHHMNKQFTDALCTMLNHPRKCPHNLDIPMGECCRQHNRAAEQQPDIGAKSMQAQAS